MQTKVKMVVTDLDGTLLKTDKTISEYTKNVIKKFMDEGNIFAIATSRPLNVVQELIKDLDYDAAICHNGVRTLFNNQELKYFGINDTYKIVKTYLNLNPSIHIAVGKDCLMYANFEIDKLMTNCPYIYTHDFEEIANISASTIVIEASNKEQLEQYATYLPDSYYIQVIENKVGLILNRNATKLNGILQILNESNVPIENVYAFGDDYNDIEMIKACGVGIAMENAIPSVKSVANVICKSNESDGVAQWIESNLLVS